MIKKKYDYLEKAYSEWHETKLGYLFTDDLEPIEALCKDLKITPLEFKTKYIDIFSDFSVSQLNHFFHALEKELNRKNPSYDYFIDLKTKKELEILRWVDVFFYRLNFFEVPFVEIPYQQCNICGKLQGFTFKDFRTGLERKRKFNKRNLYCHVDGCELPKDDKNYTGHPNCCYGRIKKIKHHKIQKYKNKNTPEEKEKNKEDFIKLCDEVYEWYLNNVEYTVQRYDIFGTFHPAKHKSEW